jgi:diphthamide synthase subunit DPH2
MDFLFGACCIGDMDAFDIVTHRGINEYVIPMEDKIIFFNFHNGFPFAV